MTLTYQFPEFQFPNLYRPRTDRDEIYWERSRALSRDTRNERAQQRPRNTQTEKKPIDRFNK